MLKENDRIAWRYKGNKVYHDGFTRETNGKMLKVDDSMFGIGQ